MYLNWLYLFINKGANLLLLVFITSWCFAQNKQDKSVQEAEVSNSTQFLIENIVADNDAEDFDFDTQFEYLEAFQKNPLDLNQANEQQLTDFGLLTAIQIQALLLYRERFGQIFSLYELQGVPTFDLRTILRLSPYVQVEKSKALEKLNFKRI